MRWWILFVAFVVSPAIAAEAPSLPKSAKKLTGPEIVALYDGATVKWHDYSVDGTGTSTYDLKGHEQHGTYTIGGQTKPFTGQIRVKRDQFCFVLVDGTETCRYVYVNGKDIYEVDRNNAVLGKSRKV